jgi:putative zinc finger protein
MNCEHIRDLLTEYLDGELPEQQRGEVAEHLAACDTCRAEFEALSKTARLVGALPRAGAPAGLSEAVVAEAARVVRARNASRVSRWVAAGGWLAAAATLALVIRYAPWDVTSPQTDPDRDLSRVAAPAVEKRSRVEPKKALKVAKNMVEAEGDEPRDGAGDGRADFAGAMEKTKLASAKSEAAAKSRTPGRTEAMVQLRATDDAEAELGKRDKTAETKVAGVSQPRAGMAPAAPRADKLDDTVVLARRTRAYTETLLDQTASVRTLTCEFTDRKTRLAEITAALKAVGGTLSETDGKKLADAKDKTDALVASVPRSKLAELVARLQPTKPEPLTKGGSAKGGGKAYDGKLLGVTADSADRDASKQGNVAKPGEATRKVADKPLDLVTIRIVLKPKR